MKKLTLKAKLIFSGSLILLTVLLFSIAVFGIRTQAFSGSVLLNYTLVGLLLALYVFALLYLDLIYALVLFLGSYIIAFISLYSTFMSTNDGFSDLAGILSWMIILVAGSIIGLLIEVIRKLKPKKTTEV